MKRREFITLVGGAAAAWPIHARAQQTRRIFKVGLLTPDGANISNANRKIIDAFIPALRELGYTEGQNLAIERRSGNADRFRELATELVRDQVDAIVVFSTPAARAVKQATTAIPIVAIAMADPVADGLIVSLARPGGNVTGTTFLGPQLVSKRLQLLSEIVPGRSRMAVLWHPNAYGERTMKGMLEEIETAAQRLEIKLQRVPVAGPDDLLGAFSAMAKQSADAFIVLPSPLLFALYPRIVMFATNNRLPAIYASREAVELGGLVSYGVNLADLSRATAIYLEKLFKGAKPAELPVQQPTKFELVINLKTAKALGLTIPQSLLTSADELIE